MMGPLFESCPLCGVTKDDSTVTGRLEDHVVGHLRHLALSSLPYVEEEEIETNSTPSLRSDDSAKPADRSTICDLRDQDSDTTFDSDSAQEPNLTLFQFFEDPYAAWNGIENYVRATHVLRPDKPPEQIAIDLSDIFTCPNIAQPGDDDDESSGCSQGGYDDSSRFINDYDIFQSRDEQVCRIFMGPSNEDQ